MQRKILLGIGAAGWPLSMAWATPFYWHGDVNGNWTGLNGSNSNWSLRASANNNTSNMPGSGDAVIFCTNGATNPTVTVPSNAVIDTLAFNNYATQPFKIQNGALTLNAAGGTGLSVDAASASHTLSTHLILGSSQSFDIQTPALSQANQLLILGQISGVGRQLTKTGGGTLELSNGTNDYSGGTLISQGLLRLSNPIHTSATGGGTVLVDSSGILGGNGSSSGPVQVKGTLAPGSGIGVLHSGAQSWFTGGRYQWEINSPTGTPGGNWDLLDINGTLDLSLAGGFSIQLLSVDNSGLPWALAGFDNTLAQSWIIAQTQGVTHFVPGLLSVDASGLANDLGGGSFAIGLEGNNLLLKYSPRTAVPEPVGLLPLVASVLIAWGRRHNKNG